MERERVTPYSIGIDLGGTSIKWVSVTASGDILSRGSEPTDLAGSRWSTRVRDRIMQLEAAAGLPARGIGVAAPGLAAEDERTIAWMQGRMAEVQGFSWTEFLDRDRPIPVLNDAQAALLGESWIGGAAGCRNVVLLTLGTGVGGAAIVDGRLLRGHLGRAGHVGHLALDPEGPLDIVGTPGSLEDAVGDWTVAARSHGRFDSTLALVEAHLGGDAEAGDIWLASVRALAAGIVSLVNVLDPEVVLLGGGIAGAGGALFEPLAGFLDRMEWRPFGEGVRLRGTELGEFAGAVGAARRAMTINLEDPT